MTAIDVSILCRDLVNVSYVTHGERREGPGEVVVEVYGVSVEGVLKYVWHQVHEPPL